jgi:GT2 family glycosyltransferase
MLNKVDNIIERNICVVTVTYGARLSLLTQLAEKVMDCQRVGLLIVVDNNSKQSLIPLLSMWGDRLKVVKTKENLGSAYGYSVGIDEALKKDLKYLLLLDDDLAPEVDSIDKLYEELIDIETVEKNSINAVVGFRKDHQTNFSSSGEIEDARPHKSSFINFHVNDIPRKIKKRIGFSGFSERKMGERIIIPFAPYGGFFANIELYRKIGSPKVDMVLYADDHEYTNRVALLGGKIFLVIGAPLIDLEESWNVQKNYSNSFEGLILGNSDFRAYYSVRNHAWFSKFIWADSKNIFYINLILFKIILFIVAIKLRKMNRYSILQEALRDGLSGKLGINKKYKLQ